jgi:hypothetical protein
VTAWRERRRLAALEQGASVTDADLEAPVTQARATGAELLRQMQSLASTLAATTDRLTTATGLLCKPT